MGLSVYDREGPYFSSGEIKWSQLRNTFKEVSSGSISALELKRNTNNDERDPIVPDAVANEDIAGWNFSSGTGDSNWKASQMRDSYKRYWARQTGTDINLRMGRYDGSTGIDWGGYGSSGRDSTSSGNGNLTKNIQKYIKIEGICGSNDSGTWSGTNNDPGAGLFTPGTAAARLAPGVPARNVRLWVYGKIHGAGGEGGYDSRGYDHATSTMFGADPGTPGGTALRIDNPNGNDVWVNIKSGSAEIYGGGGGGEQGGNGAIPQKGTCSRTWQTSGCGSAPNCSAANGGTVETTSTWTGGCCSWGQWCWSRWPFGTFCNSYCNSNTQGNNCKETVESIRPTQGIGGRGGNGQGYNLSRTNGQDGTTPNPLVNTCISGYDYNNDGEDTSAGLRGGDGGNWGNAGQDTSANNALRPPQPSTGGYDGRAICGNKFTVSGTINNNTIKGTYTGNCPGSTGGSAPPPSAPNVSLSQSGSGPFTLTWSCTSSTTITNVFGQSTPSDGSWNPTTNSGSTTVNPSQTTTYKVFAQNAGGTGNAQTTCTVSGSTPGTNLTDFTVSRNSSHSISNTFSKQSGTGVVQMTFSRSSNGSSVVQHDISPGAKYLAAQTTISTTPSAGIPSLMRINPSNASQIQFEEQMTNGNWDALTVTAANGTFTYFSTSNPNSTRDWPIYIRGLRFHNDNGTHNSNGNYGGSPSIQNSGQRLCMFDEDGSDCNATFDIISNNTGGSVQFVSTRGSAPNGEPPSGAALRVTNGGGDITLKLSWDDNPWTSRSAMTSIILRGQTWVRSGGAYPRLFPFWNDHQNSDQYNPSQAWIVTSTIPGGWNGQKLRITDGNVDLRNLGVISTSGNATLTKTMNYKGQTFTINVTAIPWDDGDNDGWYSDWWISSCTPIHELHKGETYGDNTNAWRFNGDDYTSPGSPIRFDPDSDAQNGYLDFAIQFVGLDGSTWIANGNTGDLTIPISGGNIEYTR